MEEILIPAAIFVASILGGCIIYEYSAWRSMRKMKKFMTKYQIEEKLKILNEVDLQDVIKTLKEIKEALV